MSRKMGGFLRLTRNRSLRELLGYVKRKAYKFLRKIAQFGIFSERSAIVDRASSEKCQNTRF
ncbi:hypothetical protein IJI69_00675 [Candidatus Saccharibacteria bacterium]|nr:hypothetical protein [Candidatus Saccharibacteria bacterium]